MVILDRRDLYEEGRWFRKLFEITIQPTSTIRWSIILKKVLICIFLITMTAWQKDIELWLEFFYCIYICIFCIFIVLFLCISVCLCIITFCRRHQCMELCLQNDNYTFDLFQTITAIVSTITRMINLIWIPDDNCKFWQGFVNT